MAMPQVVYYSADMVRALPDDGNRYETVHGELLVTPSPGGFHQLAIGELFLALRNCLDRVGIRGVLMAPADVSFGDDTLVQPDLFVADLSVFERTGRWSDLGELYLVIEIVSPSSTRADRFTKRSLYQQQRVPEHWVVDLERECVEVWTPEATLPRVERDRLVWRHPRMDEVCVIELGQVFRRAP
jgi:Uma2 family endonuclease